MYEAALSIFRRDGVAEARIEDIAEMAGVSRATFYFHFPTKELVLLEHLRQSETRTALLLDALPDSASLELVLDTLRKDDDTSIDEVIRKSGLPSSMVSVALLSLEMKRVVKQLPGKLFVRNR